MYIYLTVLIGLLGLCVGAMIGFGIDFKIGEVAGRCDALQQPL